MRRHRHGEFSWRLFFLGAARKLGIRTTRSPTSQDQIDTIDAASRPYQGIDDDDDLTRTLLAIECDALAIYTVQGLPTRTGHYARAPGDEEWQFVAQDLRPQDRWTLVQDYPPEQGWRFATLQTLGLNEADDSPARSAAQALVECRALRDSLVARDPTTREALERSIRLGRAWSDLGKHAPASTTVLAKPRKISHFKPRM